MLIETDEDLAGSATVSRCYKDKCRLGPCTVPLWCFRKNTDCCGFTLLSCGGVFLVLAFVIPAVLKNLLESGVGASLVLDSESSDSFAGWQTNAGDPDAPTIHYDLYMFDVVNAEEVQPRAVCRACAGTPPPHDRSSAVAPHVVIFSLGRVSVCVGGGGCSWCATPAAGPTRALTPTRPRRALGTLQSSWSAVREDSPLFPAFVLFICAALSLRPFLRVAPPGPYAYIKYWRRFDVSWSNGGQHLTYTEQDWLVAGFQSALKYTSELALGTSVLLRRRSAAGWAERIVPWHPSPRLAGTRGTPRGPGPAWPSPTC